LRRLTQLLRQFRPVARGVREPENFVGRSAIFKNDDARLRNSLFTKSVNSKRRVLKVGTITYVRNSFLKSRRPCPVGVA
jgi:hypothetical protein